MSTHPLDGASGVQGAASAGGRPPPPRSDRSPSFTAILQRELLESERRKGILIAGLHLPIALINLVLMATTGAGSFQHLDRPVWRYLLPAGLAMVGVYGAALALYVTRLLRRGRTMPAGLSYATALIELSLPSMMLVVLMVVTDAVEALTGPPSYVYMLFIFLLALRLNLKLAVFAGFVAAAQYMLLAAAFIPEDSASRTLWALGGPGGLVMRPLVFLMVGVVTGFIARELLRRIHHAVAVVEERDRVVNIFGRYLSDDVATELLKTPGALRLGGSKRTVTILMSDLRGFSALSEQLDAGSVVRILNHYLGTMTDVILDRGGIIDEIIGDAIMVIFGAPLARPDDPDRAVACALAMQAAMDEVNAWQRANGHRPLEMGIAVHTGSVVVGNIGSEKRTKYGVVGSPVNLTSRIESYSLGGQVLVSEWTRDLLRADVAYDAEMTIHPKGVDRPLRVFSARAIGDPFDLRLPDRHQPLVQLVQPVVVRFRVLVETDVGREELAGEIVRLSQREAELRTDAVLEVHANLRLGLLAPDGEPVGDQLYARVVETGRRVALLRFTFKGEREEALLAGALAG